MNRLNAIIAALGSLVDEISGLPPGQLANEIGMVVLALGTLGVLHVAYAPAFANALAALVIAIAAVGVALERAIKASK